MAERNWRQAALEAIDQKTKPPGSLGRLEEWAVRLAVLQQTLEPRVERAAVLVFGADHGVTAEGVSAYPREVTAQMMRNFAAGGAAINVLARSAGLDVDVVDVGVDADLQGLPGIVAATVRRGSRNFARAPAMTPEELEAALDAGRKAVDRLHRRGTTAVGLGEMGIGNTTAAAALLSALTAASAERTVGRGTGVDDDGLRRKRRVVAAALERHAGLLGDPASCLRAVGGLEIAALAGAAREAARRRMAVARPSAMRSRQRALQCTCHAEHERLLPARRHELTSDRQPCRRADRQ
jgi:nicotinate-nucleotide--dimethylbenzimidazole phosphoribosyltransferase